MKPYRTMIRRNLSGVACVALLGVLTSLAMVFAGYSLSFLFTACEADGDRTRALISTFLIVTSIWLTAILLYYVSLLAKAKLEKRLKTELRRMVGGKIGSMRVSDFAQKDSGHYVSWLTNDVNEIYSQSFAALHSGIENLATAVFSLGALCLLSPYIGVAAVLLLAVISVLPQLTNKRLQRANAERSAAMEVSTERYKDAIMGASVLFLANLRERIGQRIVAASETAEQACYRYNKTNAAVSILISTASMVGQIILLFVTLLAAITGTTPAGAALSVGNLAGSFFGSAGDLVQHFLTVRSSKSLWEKLIVENTADDENGDVGDIPEIRLEDISFQYGERSVLENRNDTFRAGGKYAIMGESGSGKTTLAKLLLGLLPGYSGHVWYGAREQKEIRPESLHDHIAYVDQQVYLFQDTVRFNITLGRPYTDEEIESVLRRCRLDEYVRSLPEDLDSVILENGKEPVRRAAPAHRLSPRPDSQGAIRPSGRGHLRAGRSNRAGHRNPPACRAGAVRHSHHAQSEGFHTPETDRRISARLIPIPQKF